MYTRCILLCLLTILSSIYIFGGNYSKNFIRFDYPDTYVVDAEQSQNDAFGIQCTKRSDRGCFITLNYSRIAEMDDASQEDKWVFAKYMLVQSKSKLEQRRLINDIQYGDIKMEITPKETMSYVEFTGKYNYNNENIIGVLTCSLINGYTLFTIQLSGNQSGLYELKEIKNSIKLIK